MQAHLVGLQAEEDAQNENHKHRDGKRHRVSQMEHRIPLQGPSPKARQGRICLRFRKRVRAVPRGIPMTSSRSFRVDVPGVRASRGRTGARAEHSRRHRVAECFPWANGDAPILIQAAKRDWRSWDGNGCCRVREGGASGRAWGGAGRSWGPPRAQPCDAKRPGRAGFNRLAPRAFALILEKPPRKFGETRQKQLTGAGPCRLRA